MFAEFGGRYAGSAPSKYAPLAPGNNAQVQEDGTAVYWPALAHDRYFEVI